MTTDELVRLIEMADARHRLGAHDPAVEHRGAGCAVTIGDLSSLSGVARRTIEDAIQHARLEGTPIITDGGIRVARTAAEAHALYRWLRARMLTQSRTAWAVRSQAMLMQRGERAAFKRLELARIADLQARLWDVA